MTEPLAKVRTTPKHRPRTLDQELTEALRVAMQRVGFPDLYDPDYVLGSVMEWLRANDAALTSTGVRRFRR